MKHKLIGLILIIIFSFSGCERNPLTSEGIYFSESEGFITVDNQGGKKLITISSSILMQEDNRIDIAFEPQLVDTYNAKNGTDYKPLPNKFISLSANKVAILSGTSVSQALELSIAPLDNTVNESDNLLIPLTIKSTSGSIPLIESKRTLFVKLRKVLVKPVLDLSKCNSPVTFKMPNQLTNLKQFTVEFRIKNTQTFINNMTLFSAYPSEIYSRFGDVVIDSNQLQVKYAGVQPASSFHFQSNQWYHIAYVFDGSSNSFKIYVDGNLDSTSSAPPNTSFNINKMSFGSPSSLQVQELRFWTVVRNPQEIATNICAVNPKSNGLYGYWKFDEGRGNTIKDATGNGHDGSFTSTQNPWVSGIRCPN